MDDGVGSIFKIPELKRRLLFTLTMLAVYRLGVFVSTPGIDVEALRRMFDVADGTLFGLINMFSGGAFHNFSIFTLGIAPYISVSIIVQLLTPVLPSLDRLRKEGDSGRRVLTRYTRYGTIVLALFQSFWVAVGLEQQPGLVLDPGLTFRITTMITLTAGTAFVMWLGEQITERGLGNGTSIIIFAGIIARMPQVLFSTIALARTGEIAPLAVIGLLLFCVASIYCIVFVERSNRRIPIHYPRRAAVQKMATVPTQYLPLKVNLVGVIPPIFASALLVLPATMASFSTNETIHDYLNFIVPGSWGYETIFVVLVIFFSYFYASVIFSPEDVSENLKKNGAFIPSVRPGQQTVDFLYGVLSRLTLWGALYISIVCVLPQAVYLYYGATAFAYVFGGTAILIVVGVTLDTASQIESMVVARNYEAFMSRSSKMRGGMGGVMGQMRSRILKR